MKYSKWLRSIFLDFGGGLFGDEKHDVCLEWNKVLFNVNIMDHNGPLDNNPGRSLYWLESVEEGGKPAITQGPPAAARAAAMTHMAMFEAYNCISGKYHSYFGDDDFSQCTGASMEVAVAQAARDVMNGLDGMPGLYGHNQDIMDYIDSALEATILRERNVIAKESGIEVGHEIAMKVLVDRKDDGYSVGNSYLLDEEYIPTDAVGVHRVDPLNPNQGFLSPGAGLMAAFSMTQDEMKEFKASAPPGMDMNEAKFDPTDEAYVASLLQVKKLGVWRGGNEDDPISTDDLTYVIANFWSANHSPKLGTPTCVYNDIVRKIAIEKDNSLEENMLLFTVVHMAMADTAMSTWDSKFTYKLWRPIIAVREHPEPKKSVCKPKERVAKTGKKEHVAKANTIRDETWEPLGASRSNPYAGEKNFSPPFPGHTSGHAAFGCTTFQTLANFYGSYNIPFEYTSPEWNGKTRDMYNRVRPCLKRKYPSLLDAMAENAASRVFNGVHFDFEGVKGCQSGMKIANYIWENKFLPSNPLSDRNVLTTDEMPDRINLVLGNAQTSGYQADMCNLNDAPAYPYDLE